jgi:hypothetical protein
MADGDQTIVLTSETPYDGLNKIKESNVWESVITATFDADDTTALSLALPLNGVLRHISFAIPQTTTSRTKQLQINDNGNNTVFDTGALANVAGASTTNYSVDEPLSGTIDVVVTIAGTLGGTGVAMVITLRGV